MMRNKRALALLLMALMLLSLCSCGLIPKEEERRKAPLVKTAEAEQFELSYVTRGDMELKKKISCSYVPIVTAHIYFTVNGEYIDEMFVNPGDSVTKGTLLGQLKLDGVDEEIQACAREIRLTELTLTQSEENRVRALNRQKILNPSDAKQLAEALKNVNESYDKARRDIEDTLYVAKMKQNELIEKRAARQLVSPIDGTVTYVRKYTESSVSSTTERAVTVADSTMSLFTANTDLWEYLTVGETVTITVKKVDYEAVVADETALGLPAETRVPGEKAKMYFTLVNPTFDLEDNEKGTMTILLDARTDVIKVSEAAVSRANGQTIVYYQDEQGMKSYKPVTLGLLAEKQYEVLEGLTEGEAVIIG